MNVLTDTVTVTPTTVASGGTLHQGDTLKTDTSGLAEVDYPDDSFTRIGPDSTVTLTTLATTTGSRQIDQKLSGAGETYSRVATLSGSESFTVTTDQASAAVRGSEFAVLCTTATSCEFAAIVDELLVTTPSGESVTLQPGQFVVVTDGKIGQVTSTGSAQMTDWITENQALSSGGTPTPPTAATCLDQEAMHALDDKYSADWTAYIRKDVEKWRESVSADLEAEASLTEGFPDVSNMFAKAAAIARSAKASTWDEPPFTTVNKETHFRDIATATAFGEPAC
ncbi:MAG: FecR family protein [Actinomycetota bacterium]|nr:FecR family protein [Actinomycetota bacterium]